MNDKIYFTTAFFILLFLGIGLGWSLHGLYQSYSNERILNGLSIRNADYEYANKKAYELDDKGDWVCINVAYDMPYPEAYNTCVHECSHRAYSEIFAEHCEDDLDKCKELIDSQK